MNRYNVILQAYGIRRDYIVVAANATDAKVEAERNSSIGIAKRVVLLEKNVKEI